ncbi:MAG: hypothetical protein ACKVIM_01305 [Flavobacteriales bacterium]|jgi:ABC-type glycerol-3-phosphate transport system permease component|tara:strand:- start:538 stop:870 length:333 start_codon:yes stop_codon:yes gene_type:complete
MKNSKTTKSLFNISVLLLIIIMLLPTVVQFTHVFKEHEQTNCKVLTSHIHEQEVGCSICDFHSSSFNYSFTNLKEIINTNNPITYADYYRSKKHNAIKLLYSLRGPPLFS